MNKLNPFIGDLSIVIKQCLLLLREQDSAMPKRELYAVNAILHHEMVSLECTKFKVWWRNCPRDEAGPEPLEHLLTVPLLLLKYVKKAEKDYKMKLKRLLGPKADTKFSFPQPSADIRRKAEKNGEYWPTADDTVAKIYHEFHTKEKHAFWLVKFFRKPKRVLVRRSVMEYFFPINSLTFIHKTQRR